MGEPGPDGDSYETVNDLMRAADGVEAAGAGTAGTGTAMGMVMKVAVAAAVVGVSAYGTWALAIKEEKLPQDEEDDDLPQDEDEEDDDEDHPQDCVYEEGELGECDAACGETGVRRGEVVVVREADVGGEPCPTEVTEACTGPPCQPCVTSDWVIGECLGPSGESCHPLAGQKGERRNTRTVLDNPDGQPCGELEETQECDLQQCVSCVYEEDWVPVGVCQPVGDGPDCGTGKQLQKRDVVDYRDGDETSCPQMTREIDCALRDCVPCVYEEDWVSVGGCQPVGDGPDCGATGKQLQKRDVVDYGDGDETSCLQLTREIDCALRDCVPCVYEEDWVPVGGCQPVGDGADCGTGKQLQKRDVVDYGDGDETSCLQLTQEIDCALRDCEPCESFYIDGPCVDSDGQTCGGDEGARIAGQFVRSRITQSNPDNQPCGDDAVALDCELPLCPIDCETDWVNTGDCTATSCYEAGTQMQEQVKVQEAKYDGKECDPLQIREVPCTMTCDLDTRFLYVDRLMRCEEDMRVIGAVRVRGSIVVRMQEDDPWPEADFPEMSTDVATVDFLHRAYGIPVGGIMPFVGQESDIPQNWVICDGRSYSMVDGSTGVTPDLVGRYVRGPPASVFYSGEYRPDLFEPGATEGSEQQELSVDHFPPHNHGGRTDVGMVPGAEVGEEGTEVRMSCGGSLDADRSDHLHHHDVIAVAFRNEGIFGVPRVPSCHADNCRVQLSYDCPDSLPEDSVCIDLNDDNNFVEAIMTHDLASAPGDIGDVRVIEDLFGGEDTPHTHNVSLSHDHQGALAEIVGVGVMVDKPTISRIPKFYGVLFIMRVR